MKKTYLVMDFDWDWQKLFLQFVIQVLGLYGIKDIAHSRGGRIWQPLKGLDWIVTWEQGKHIVMWTTFPCCCAVRKKYPFSFRYKYKIPAYELFSMQSIKSKTINIMINHDVLWRNKTQTQEATATRWRWSLKVLMGWLRQTRGCG